MALSLKLGVFEGPLDLLLHLIEKNKVDIYDIPIVEITDQYMEYLHSMEEVDLGVMSEFLVMAAALLDIKCRMLLPGEKDEEDVEEDPRADLVEKLLEYKMYKYMSYELKDKMDEADAVFFHRQDIPKEVQSYKVPVNPEELLEGLTLERLHAVFQSIMRRQNDRVDPVRSRFGRIEKEAVSVADRIQAIRDYASSHRKFTFRELLGKRKSRLYIVVSFLSILELIKMGHLGVSQEQLAGDIEILVRDDPAAWNNLTEEEGLL